MTNMCVELKEREECRKKLINEDGRELEWMNEIKKIRKQFG